MSRKHAELEREFIEDLEPRTGRVLAAWMSLIDDTGLTDRNAIIDWLRPQGLTFAHASWLERIHHNGGRPIYGDAPERPPHPASPRPVTEPPAPRQVPAPPPAPPPRLSPVPRSQPLASPMVPATAVVTMPPGPQTATSDVSLADLLARGKGLRPMADMLLREIAQAVPGVVTVPAGELLSLQRQAEFAVLLIGPKELRLGLDLGDWPTDGLVTRSRIPGTTARITHMLVINDARRVGPALMELIQRAAARADPGTP
jgi:hypothetical protein